MLQFVIYWIDKFEFCEVYMYICNDTVCDPCCDFCWYCIHGKNGEPISCVKNKSGFDNGLGYCDDYKCSLHETKPHELV